MKRDIYNDLIVWKNSKQRKPLILKGARQVGKTYVLKKFGKNEYKNLVYFNFEEDSNLGDVFKGRISPLKIIEKLSIALEKKIQAEETLIIFDEIQESPEALTSLKYFCENNNEYHIIASGSLLGIRLGQKRSFPVGKVNILHLYPFSFGEYLDGIGKPFLRNLIKSKKDFKEIENKFHEEFIEALKMYFFIGGMPEAINIYNQDRDLTSVRRLQKEILQGYESDFAKHMSKPDAIKIRNIWHTIPSQLAKENKKFQFSNIKKNARLRDYNESIQWLLTTGYIYKSYRIKIPKLPLNAYSEENIFKLFLLDVGLLGAMLDLTQKTIIKGNKLFLWYNGAFTENFVAQELVSMGNNNLYYWTSESKAEVDFLLPYEENIYPLEVKSGLKIKAKSLKVYYEKYKPQVLSRTSLLNFKKSKKHNDYPLYAISLFPKIGCN